MSRTVFNDMTAEAMSLLAPAESGYTLEARLMEVLEGGKDVAFGVLFSAVADCYLQTVEAEEVRLALGRLETQGLVTHQAALSGQTCWTRT